MTVSTVTHNTENGTTHLIKIQIFDMKKLVNLNSVEHWKYVDVQVNYYVKPESNKHHQKTRGLVNSNTRELSKSPNCKTYNIKNLHSGKVTQ